MYVEGERGGIYVTFAYYIFAGDRENQGLNDTNREVNEPIIKKGPRP